MWAASMRGFTFGIAGMVGDGFVLPEDTVGCLVLPGGIGCGTYNFIRFPNVGDKVCKC